MSGYKRVNFYELCRLCASNHQKEKTHIFHEEGRKIQLQNKIQSCLSLTVCENDFLPKVVCSQCLRVLEECYVFRKKCTTSETMLSSYFKNFRYTEDFKKSGKVYIKDTSSKLNTSESVTSTTNVATNFTETIKTNNTEQVPLYTVQLPTTLIQNQDNNVKQTNSKIQNIQIAYNVNNINNNNNNKPKTNVDALNNIAVNANGEIINIGQLVDLDTFISQSAPKFKTNQQQLKTTTNTKNKIDDPSVIKIDLTQSDLNAQAAYDSLKCDKLPHIKSTQVGNNKFTYTIKLDDKVANQAVILNQVSDINPTPNLTYNFNSNNYATTPALNQLNYAQQNLLQTDLNAGYNSVNKPVTYSNCPRTTNSFTATTKAVTYASNQPSTTTIPVTTEPVKQHICDICKKMFKRREHLFQHLKLHTGFRPFTCDSCNKSFMRKEHLFRHMTSHSGLKNYTCNICEKSFSRNDNLLKHKKTHEKQSSFTCEVCQKQFVMKHYYLAHKMMHENNKCNVNQTWGLLKA